MFANTGIAILDLADSNGITLGKSSTNVLSVTGKADTTKGFINFAMTQMILDTMELTYHMITYSSAAVA